MMFKKTVVLMIAGLLSFAAAERFHPYVNQKAGYSLNVPGSWKVEGAGTLNTVLSSGMTAQGEYGCTLTISMTDDSAVTSSRATGEAGSKLHSRWYADFEANYNHGSKYKVFHEGPFRLGGKPGYVVVILVENFSHTGQGGALQVVSAVTEKKTYDLAYGCVSRSYNRLLPVLNQMLQSFKIR